MFNDLFGTVQYSRKKWSGGYRMSKYIDYLRKLDYTPGNPGALKLYQAVKQGGKYKNGIRRIRQFLNNKDPYSLMKSIRRTFPRSKVVLGTIESLWDGDLADVTNIFRSTDLQLLQNYH